jgi:ABC-type molybdate transport system substrate-binding protein
MSFDLHERSNIAMKRRLLVIATIMSSLTMPAIASDAVLLHAAQKENVELQMIALPDALAVSADYGLTVMSYASPGAYRFALFVLSPEGQHILAGYGFSAPNRP